MDYFALFYTTTGAVKFKRKLDDMAVPVELLPIPSALSAGCGVAAKFSAIDPNKYIDDSVEKLYWFDDGKYIFYNSKETNNE